MANNDSKRYYWLKLKKDFFQQHQIKVLKAMPNGRLYALIYVELLAESTSHNGKLRYSEMLPYDLPTLASVIDEDVDNLKCAIDILVKLELVEILDDQTIYMCELEKLIGSETGQTIRKREAKIEGGKCLVKNTQDTRVKSIDIDNRYVVVVGEKIHKIIYDTYKAVFEQSIELEEDYRKRLENELSNFICEKMNIDEIDKILCFEDVIMFNIIDIYRQVFGLVYAEKYDFVKNKEGFLISIIRNEIGKVNKENKQ